MALRSKRHLNHKNNSLKKEIKALNYEIHALHGLASQTPLIMCQHCGSLSNGFADKINIVVENTNNIKESPWPMEALEDLLDDILDSRVVMNTPTVEIEYKCYNCNKNTKVSILLDESLKYEDNNYLVKVEYNENG